MEGVYDGLLNSPSGVASLRGSEKNKKRRKDTMKINRIITVGIPLILCVIGVWIAMDVRFAKLNMKEAEKFEEWKEIQKRMKEDKWEYEAELENMKEYKDYHAFLERNPDYVKAQNEYNMKAAELKALDTTMEFSYAKLKREVDDLNLEKKMLENRLCADAEDPMDLAVIREYFFLRQDIFPFTGINEAPKKDIPGSPEFQFAMYTIDKAKEIGPVSYPSAQNLRGKWLGRAYQGLYYNFQKAFFDNPEWRKLKYETDYAKLAHQKRYSELMNTDDHIQLWKEYAAASASDYKKAQELSDKIQAITRADTIYQKLKDEHRQLEQKQMREWSGFRRNSDSPAAKEYREFEAARQELFKKK